MIYLLLTLNLISDSDNGIESEFQCQVNHGPELDVDLDFHTNP